MLGCRNRTLWIGEVAGQVGIGHEGGVGGSVTGDQPGGERALGRGRRGAGLEVVGRDDEPLGPQLSQQVQSGRYRRGREDGDRSVRDHAQLVHEHPVPMVQEVTVDVRASGLAPRLGISGDER